MLCNKKLKIGIIFLCVLFAFSGCGAGHGEISLESLEEEPVLQEGISETEQPNLIAVHVCGEVMAPGVYYFPEPVRVVEAIEKAGGFLETAATAYLNLAAFVADGEQLYVPTKEEAAEHKLSEDKALLQKVDINVASKEVLMTLPGIGESRADDIISYRTRSGVFETAEDIMKVSGIKQSVYEKISDKICVK